VRTIQMQLNASVRDQCISDVPLGVFLSGGIDSAALAAVARNHRAPIHTFSVGFESSGGTDELADAAATARALGTHHRQTILDDDWILLQWREWLLSADRPSIDGLNTYVISGVVKDGGATVALSGLGADELFGGYPQFQTVPRLFGWLKPFVWMPKAMRRVLAQGAFGMLRRSRRERALELVGGCSSPLDLLLQMRRLLTNVEMSTVGFSPRDLRLDSSFLPQEIYESLQSGRSNEVFGALSQAECLLYMGNTLLRDSDTNSMAHSLEIRVPFLGRWFADAVSALPGAVKMPPHAAPKYLLRKALGSVLPYDLFTRPKRGFSLPIGEWMFGPLRDQCEGAISTLADCPIFSSGAIARLWDGYKSQRHAMHWSRPLSLVVLGNYLQQSHARVGQASACRQ
jgi:asparagine synthase (glutamine-hydrolysing)